MEFILGLEVMEAYPAKGKVLVGGVNVVTKHKKAQGEGVQRDPEHIVAVGGAQGHGAGKGAGAQGKGSVHKARSRKLAVAKEFLKGRLFI